MGLGVRAISAIGKVVDRAARGAEPLGKALFPRRRRTRGARIRAGIARWAGRAVMATLVLLVLSATVPATSAWADWSEVYDKADQQVQMDEREAVDAKDIGDKKISEAKPKWALNWDAVGAGLTDLIFNHVVGPLVAWCCDVIKFFLGILDKSTNALFTQDFNSEQTSSFYQVAKKISDRVAIPVGSSFLGLTFGLAMLRSTDPRQRMQGPEWMQGFVAIGVMFAISWTLILHALDICEVIYWVGGQLVRGVNAAVAPAPGIQHAFEIFGQDGTPVGAAVMAQQVTEGLTDALMNLTYKDSGNMWGVLIVSLFAVFTAVGCMCYVLTVAFLRLGEVYLRSSVSAIAMAFFTSRDTRSMGWNWLKRFGAVCFQAGIIVIALSMAGFLFNISQTLIAPLLSDGGGVDYFKSLLPSLIALGCITTMVKKSEQVANGLFGLQ